MPRKLMMIAAAFPPTGGPGVQRTAKFAKYLLDFEWHPFVWSLDQMEGLPQDPTLLHELPREVIRRIPETTSPDESCSSHRADPWLLDDLGVWARQSLVPLTEWVRMESIQAIYSTFSPPANHWLALQIKQRTGLPWAADFRDLWTDDCRYHEKDAARARAHQRFQQQVLEMADVVVGVTHRQTAILAGHLPRQRQKFVTITNGFDPTDFRNVDFLDQKDRPNFVVGHVGRLDQWRASDALLSGLGRFAAELDTEGDGLEVRVVGHASLDTLRRMECARIPFSYQPYVSHARAVQEMVSASALLLALPTGPNAESIIAAKLFEYLASQRPILVVGPAGGECASIVGECNAGIAVTHDETQVAVGLRHLYNAWRNGRSVRGCEETALHRYDRRELTRRLAEILDGLITAPHATHSTIERLRVSNPSRKSAPTVSIVVPTWNRASLVGRALDSVVAQTYSDWEIVLVDDGSSDETPELARQFAKRLGSRFVSLRQSNQGSSAARNLGIDASRGQFVAFLDSDDVFLPNKLERQLALFASRPELGFVYSDFAFFDEDGTRIERVMAAKWPRSREALLEQVAPNLYVCGGRLFDVLIGGYFIATIVGMVRREILGARIRFPVGFRYAEEWLFFLRVARATAAGFVDEALSVHYATKGSLARGDKTSNIVQTYKLLLTLKTAFGGLTLAQRKNLNKQLAQTARQIAYNAAREGRPATSLRSFSAAFCHQPAVRTAAEMVRAAMDCLSPRQWAGGFRPSALKNFR